MWQVASLRDIGRTAAEIVSQLEFLVDDIQNDKITVFHAFLMRVHQHTFTKIGILIIIIIIIIIIMSINLI